jgi:hypothetical protein
MKKLLHILVIIAKYEVINGCSILINVCSPKDEKVLPDALKN